MDERTLARGGDIPATALFARSAFKSDRSAILE